MRDVHFQTTGENPIAGVITLDVCKRVMIEVNGKRWRLIWSEMWGPAVGDRNGDIADKQPGPNHAFWRAATLWNRQGRRVDGLTAVWHEPAPEILQTVRRKGRRVEVRVVQAGEDPLYSRQVLLSAESDANSPSEASAGTPATDEQINPPPNLEGK